MEHAQQSQPSNMNFHIKKFEKRQFGPTAQVWERSVLDTHHFPSQKNFNAVKTILQKINFGELNVHCLVGNYKVNGFISIVDRKIEMLFLGAGYIGMGLGKKLLPWAFSEHAACRVDVNGQMYMPSISIKKQAL